MCFNLTLHKIYPPFPFRLSNNRWIALTDKVGPESNEIVSDNLVLGSVCCFERQECLEHEEQLVGMSHAKVFMEKVQADKSSNCLLEKYVLITIGL